MSTSQSFKDLEKHRFQWPISPSWTHKPVTHASFKVAKVYKEGKVHLNGSSPHHLAFQNFTLLLLPTKKEELWWKLFNSIPYSLPKPHTMPISYFIELPTASQKFFSHPSFFPRSQSPYIPTNDLQNPSIPYSPNQLL